MHTPRSNTATPTPKSTTKRKAEVIDLEAIQEKKATKPFRPVIKNSEQKEEEALYQVSVTTHDKFYKFPIALRNQLQAACQTSFYNHMFSLQTGATPKSHQQYSILTGTRTRTLSMGFETTIAIPNILDLSMANAALLDYFTKCCPSTYSNLKRELCVELKTQGGLLNPDFIELHAVRHGELGWGFDADGCLSLYVTVVAENKLKERVWYVKAGGIKIEDES